MSRFRRDQREIVERTLPWAVSLALHAALVIGGVFLVWSVSRPEKPASPPVETSFLNPAVAPDSPRDAPESSELESPSPQDLERPQLEALQIEVPRPELFEPVVPTTDAEPVTPQRDPGAVEELQDTRMQRRYPEVRFAGLGAGNAQDVVYVIDASGPMVSSLPSVKAMLKRSMEQLSPTQRFQVVLFKDGSFVSAPDPANPHLQQQWRLIRALRENREGVGEWVETVQASGKGNPAPALEHAVGLLQASETGAIFILSRASAGSGAWEQSREQILATLDRLNPRDQRTGRRRLAIHSVQFIDLDEAGVLEAIAREHGSPRGDSFTVISRQQLEELLDQ